MEEATLGGEASLCGVAAECAAAGNDPVAGDLRRPPVALQGLPHHPGGLWLADRPRDLGVGADLPFWNFKNRLVHLPLKRRNLLAPFSFWRHSGDNFLQVMDVGHPL